MKQKRETIKRQLDHALAMLQNMIEKEWIATDDDKKQKITLFIVAHYDNVEPHIALENIAETLENVRQWGSIKQAVVVGFPAVLDATSL